MQRKSTNQRKKERGSIADFFEKIVELTTSQTLSRDVSRWPTWRRLTMSFCKLLADLTNRTMPCIDRAKKGILLGAFRGDNMSDDFDRAIKSCTCKQ